MALKPCYWHILLARSCDSWLQARHPKTSTLLEAGRSLCGCLGRAGEPGLARHCSGSPLAWKLPASTAAARSGGSSRAPFISASFPRACRAHRRPHPAAPRSRELLCLGTERLPEPTRSHGSQGFLGPAVQSCCSCCREGSRKHTAAPNTLPARSWWLRGAGQPLTDLLTHSVLCFRPRPVNPFAVGGEDLDPFG